MHIEWTTKRISAGLIAIVVVGVTFLTIQLASQPAAGATALSALATEEQERLVKAVEAGNTLFIRVETFEQDRVVFGLGSQPDRIVMEWQLSADPAGTITEFVGEAYTMTGTLLSTTIVMGNEAIITDATTGAVHSFRAAEQRGTLADWLTGRFAISEKLRVQGYVERPDEAIDGRSIKVFDSADTVNGTKRETSLRIPIDNPLLSDSKNFVVDGDTRTLVGQTTYLEVSIQGD